MPPNLRNSLSDTIGCKDLGSNYANLADHERYPSEDKSVSSNQAADPPDKTPGKDVGSEPAAYATSSQNPWQESIGNLVEVEYLADGLLIAKEEEPEAEDLANWDDIQIRIRNNLKHAGIEHNILVLSFALAARMKLPRRLLSMKFTSILSRSKFNNEHSQVVRGDDGGFSVPRNRLNPTILFSCPLSDHTLMGKFINSQKWLRRSVYDAVVVEGSYNFNGKLATEQSGVGVLVHWPCTMLCGVSGRLTTSGTATDSDLWPHDASSFTIGGILLIDDELFSMTVGHVFSSSHYVRRLRERDDIIELSERPEFRVGDLFQSTWSGDADRSDSARGDDQSNCDWALIRLNDSQPWAANYFIINDSDRDSKRLLTNNKITRFADEADLKNRELLKGKVFILAGRSGVVPGRLKVTPTQIYLHGNWFIAREVLTESELRESP